MIAFSSSIALNNAYEVCINVILPHTGYIVYICITLISGVAQYAYSPVNFLAEVPYDVNKLHYFQIF